MRPTLIADSTDPGFSAHLHGSGTSFVLATPPPTAERPDPLPVVAHFGRELPASIDPDALLRSLLPSRTHSGPDFRALRPVVPQQMDGTRLRPTLRGSRADGTAWSPGFKLTDASADTTSAHVTLIDETAGLELRLSWRLDSGVLVADRTLVNLGTDPYRVDGLASSLPMPDAAREILDLTGRWCHERDHQRHPLEIGAWVRDGRHGRTGHDSPLVLVVGTPGFGFRHGEVWGVHHGWSGDSTYWAERAADSTAQFGVEERLEPGELNVAPGESYNAPPAYCVYSNAGMDGMSDAFHDFIRARKVHPTTPRPVLLNTWEAVYFDHDLDRLKALADKAAAVGIERFVLDDGWFGGRRDDTAGLGDWWISPDMWPNGLTPIIEHVTGLGMEFGLWFEPEMVNPNSDLFRAHPDWILHTDGRTPPVWRDQQVLDLGRPEVEAYLLERLDTLLSENNISYIKWDHNRDVVDAGHHGRPGVHGQTLAVYRLWDELKRRHPNVEIETCASGGGRIDLGALARADRVWASDTIDPIERQHIQRWTGLLLPPELVGAHVGSEQAHTTHRVTSLGLRAATALFGHMGFELDLTQLSDADLAGVAELIAVHKRFRPLLHSGRVVRFDMPDEQSLAHGVVAHDGSEALFCYVQLASARTEMLPPLKFPGLNPDATYRVEVTRVGADTGTHEIAPPPWLATGTRLTGTELDAVGVQLPVISPAQAMVFHVQRV